MKTTMKTGALLLAMLFGACLLHAQTYMLMAVSGDVQMNAGGQWKKANTGSKLGPSDQVKLGERSYAAIVVNGTKTYELKKVGVVTMNQLSAGATGANGVMSKYVDYVVNRSTSNKLGNNMSNLGAVERSVAPTPMAPRLGNVAEETVRFTWRKQQGAKSYFFVISDIEQKRLVEQTVTDTFVVVNLKEAKVEPGEFYFWKVSSSNMKGMMSDDVAFQMLTPQKRQEIAKAVKEMKTEMGTEETAIGYMVLASYYQDQGVNDKAMEAYEKAIRLEPSVKEYKLMYAEFLQKINLNGYAKEVAESAK
jgi:hypothetical protein